MEHLRDALALTWQEPGQRGPGERITAQLKNWRILGKIRQSEPGLRARCRSSHRHDRRRLTRWQRRRAADARDVVQ